MAGNHVSKVQALLKTGAIKTSDLTKLNIFHDEGCALLRQRGDCNCDPVIEIDKPKARPAAKLNRDK